MNELENERERLITALQAIANGTWESFHIDSADGHRVEVDGGNRFVHEKTLYDVLQIARDALREQKKFEPA